MKLTIIVPNLSHPEFSQILHEAQLRGIEANIVAITTKNRDELLAKIEEVGDIVLWYGAVIPVAMRAEAKRIFVNRSIKVINDIIFEKPVRWKDFQQSVLSESLKSYHIPTLRIPAGVFVGEILKKSNFQLPVIAKPNYGSKGDGIEYIDDAYKSDVCYGVDYVIQPYVPNEGDWRVLVIQNETIGAVLRKAKNNSVLNNYSKGADVFPEKDPKVLSDLFEIALAATQCFELDYAGVDIIRDKNTDRYSILEVNTHPFWEGFEKALPDSRVASKLVDMIQLMYGSKP